MNGMQVLSTIVLLVWLIVLTQTASRGKADSLPSIVAFCGSVALCVWVIV